ncbi:hypothetical protein A2856_01365 [Candidatus Uhrbacteria bacterium RIFCSPHIGHO2_01_FULL_63_20]|uniref:Glycosyltransferase subfamily 4-like N-terminal domain-containing protein n=1 Tax=Candidatus Uhrbacteria bacterium RIFCSPHIGHO2_01_FULL_63_20 TaxID=1802385 RepID=A0A1F7TL31_9BACT|nr:MAG: hypothetical protein A2856_01365 [Candidatus Uhrbacteria bacterium RIFCSPHIGHO2_01_FULL_63_20]
MTILQVNKFWFMKGGAERYALELSAWLVSQGHEVVPFAMEHPENLPSPYASAFPPFLRTDRVGFGPGGFRTFSNMMWNARARRGLRSLVRETRPDIAHVHNIYTQLSPSVLDALADEGVPTVMTVHDHHLVSPAYDRWAEGCGPAVEKMGVIRATRSKFHKGSYAASFAQAFVFSLHKRLRLYEVGIRAYLCPSRYIERELRGAGFPSERLRYLPFGIDPDLVRPRADHDGYVLAVGRLVPQKGMAMVIRVARMLPEIRFKIVGSGPDEPRLHALGHGLGNVEFLGRRTGEDLDRLYQGAAALMMPSRFHETFGLTALEAMRAGKPVAASAVGALPELVQDRVTGYLVSPLDVHGWAEAVLRLVYDDAMRRKMGREGRLLAETTFHIRRHRQKLMETYEHVRTKNRPA